VIDIDHLTAGPWHRFAISSDHGVSRTLTHPDECHPRCRLGRLLGITGPAGLQQLTADFPFGEYRLRWSPRGVDAQHPDGTDIDGYQPTPPDPVVLTRAELEFLGDVADQALNAYHHDDQCACGLWPKDCASSSYRAGMWDTGAWCPALPAILAAWAQLRPTTEAPDTGRPE
jgi:hypothetical protein